MKKVVVVGGGPAGLAAAEALLDERGEEIDVTLVTMGHLLGGKACSWTRPDGLVAEHGQHVMLGFYDELRALLRRTGVDPEATSVSTEGHFTVFEDRDGTAHHLHLGRAPLRTLVDGLGYTGWTAAEKAGFAQLFVRAAPRVIAGVPEEWDDLCLTAWCLEHGLPASILGTNLFRASREAQLNWPGEISAYSMLKTIQIAGRDYTSSECRFPAGGMSDIWWEPIARRISDLGGTVARLRKLVGVQRREGRLSGLVFASPMPHRPTERYDRGSVPTLPGTEVVWDDFDAAVLTLPPPSLEEVLRDSDPTMLDIPGLSGIAKLTTAAPLGLHVWHRNPVTAKRNTVVCGLLPPLGFVVDNKPNYPAYRDNPDIGAALHFVGQETGFEDDDDETLLARCLETIKPIAGFEGIDREGIIGWQVVRNRAIHKRYWLAEPGSLRFKPPQRTPVPGLYLAGDWVRTALDFPCMENAVRSGRSAARLVLDDLAGVKSRRAA